ncbi:MAG: Hsp20/alpha crystallin family protein [Chloroflexota bacterium]|nr:Hsp20/alpha crystallin family protein [Chloroflexota bacterium]
MTTWDPLQEIESLRREVDRAFEDAGLGPLARRGRLAFLPGRAARQYPLVNVYDNGESFTVEALAPGLDPEKIDLSVLHNRLTIAGEKIGPQGVPPERWHRMERAAGRFMRTVELPAEVDPDKVGAMYRDGLLVITVPRAESGRPRKVAIQAG